MAKKLTDSQILGILANELSNANITTSSPSMLRDPLAYYLGLPNGTEIAGRSALTSTDVADAIEWIMPQIMESFTQNNQVVIFDPLHKEDELQAEIESEYVYDVLMKQNNGFILIHQMVKDALMQRNGMLKVYYEEEEEVEHYSYTGLAQEQVSMLLARDDTEITAMDTVDYLDEFNQPQQSFNIKIDVTTKCGQVRIDSVAPEEFRLNSQHNSISLENARFTCHIINKSISDLREEGYSDDDLESLTESDLIRSSYRFNMQNEPTLIPSTTGDDKSQTMVEIAECYMKMDVNGKGIAKLYKTTVAGVQPPTKILSQEEITCSPWVATTAILMSHKFQGLSIYDRLKEIQDNKTSLIRNAMDNIYLQNNQRYIVLENQCNVNDILVSRPGGILRAKRPDAITPLQTPQIGDTVFTMMRYLDEIKAGRSGVSADGTSSPDNIGDRVGSQGVERMMTAKEALVGLIIRVICETGIKPLCNKIRDLVTMHQDSIEDFQFKGQWVKVNPATWPKRVKSTVRVGTGTGDVDGKLAAMTQLQQIQAQIIAQPGQSLLNQDKIFATLDDFCKLSGLTSANKYFVDPQSPEGKQAAQQAQQSQGQDRQKAEMAKVEELRIQAELAKSATTTAQSLMENVNLKGQVELGKHQREMEKQTADAEIAGLKTQLEQMQLLQKNKSDFDNIKFKYDELETKTALALTELEATTKQQEEANMLANEEALDSENDEQEQEQESEPEPEPEQEQGPDKIDMLMQMVEKVSRTQGALFDSIQAVNDKVDSIPQPATQTMAAPVKVVRDDNGDIVGLE